jgi:hypothetical protein
MINNIVAWGRLFVPDNWWIINLIYAKLKAFIVVWLPHSIRYYYHIWDYLLSIINTIYSTYAGIRSRHSSKGELMATGQL